VICQEHLEDSVDQRLSVVLEGLERSVALVDLEQWVVSMELLVDLANLEASAPKTPSQFVHL